MFQLKGFTPLIDTIIQEVGLVEAAVYGVVYRYCQMEKHVCDASTERIAERVNVSSRTALRHLKALCKAGYLEDLTPSLRNVPHTYKLTSKVKLTATVEAVTESQSDEVGMTESHSHYDRESQRAMTESQLKIPIKIQEDIAHKNAQAPIQTAFIETPPPKPNRNAHFVALSKVCSINLEAMTDPQRWQLNQSAKILRDKVGASPQDIEAFATWWYANDWRGKQGTAPKPHQVREMWGQYKKPTQEQHPPGARFDNAHRPADIVEYPM